MRGAPHAGSGLQAICKAEVSRCRVAIGKRVQQASGGSRSAFVSLREYSLGFLGSWGPAKPIRLSFENKWSRLLMWFGYTDGMLWLSFVGALVVVLGVAVIVLIRRPGRDLGVVSSRWVEQHRLEP